MSIDKSINQPILPHVVLVLNATDSIIEDSHWDPETATKKLLDDYQDLPNKASHLQDICDMLGARGKSISSTRDLIEQYYASVTVIRVPARGSYMQLDEQVGKLYDIIGVKCAESQNEKRKARMLLNAESLPKYITAAHKHFCKSSDVPFDFGKVFSQTPPRDFGEHVLNLISSTYNHTPGSQRMRADGLFKKLSPFVASCIILGAMRDGTRGK